MYSFASVCHITSKCDNHKSEYDLEDIVNS